RGSLYAREAFDLGSRHERAASDPDQLQLARIHEFIKAGFADPEYVARIGNPVGHWQKWRSAVVTKRRGRLAKFCALARAS
ncbi:MAG: hypothetical protein ABL907_18240, partial [Hyphomicrobium sp.]